MKKIFSIVFILAFGMFFPACKQDDPIITIVEGIVRDGKTMEPIKGAQLSFGYYLGNNVHYPDEEFYPYTDEMGRFYVEVPSKYDVIILDWVFKTGYLPNYNFGGIASHTHIERDVQLIPLDGKIGLSLHNQTGQYDSIYVKISNATIQSQSPWKKDGVYHTKAYPAVLNDGQSSVENYDLPSGEYSKVFWDFKPFDDLQKASFQDSIWVGKDSTTVHSISF